MIVVKTLILAAFICRSICPTIPAGIICLIFDVLGNQDENGVTDRDVLSEIFSWLIQALKYLESIVENSTVSENKVPMNLTVLNSSKNPEINGQTSLLFNDLYNRPEETDAHKQADTTSESILNRQISGFDSNNDSSERKNDASDDGFEDLSNEEGFDLETYDEDSNFLLDVTHVINITDTENGETKYDFEAFVDLVLPEVEPILNGSIENSEEIQTSEEINRIHKRSYLNRRIRLNSTLRYKNLMQHYSNYFDRWFASQNISRNISRWLEDEINRDKGEKINASQNASKEIDVDNIVNNKTLANITRGLLRSLYPHTITENSTFLDIARNISRGLNSNNTGNYTSSQTVSDRQWMNAFEKFDRYVDLVFKHLMRRTGQSMIDLLNFVANISQPESN